MFTVPPTHDIYTMSTHVDARHESKSWESERERTVSVGKVRRNEFINHVRNILHQRWSSQYYNSDVTEMKILTGRFYYR